MALPSERATEVVKERGTEYGHPYPIFSVTAELWSAWLTDRRQINPEDVPIMMAMHKLARERQRPKDDNITDVCGYMNTYEMMYQPEEEQPANKKKETK